MMSNNTSVVPSDGTEHIDYYNDNDLTARAD